MTRRDVLKSTLIFGFICLAAGGWWIHYYYHPLATGFGYVPFVSGLISIVVLPIMFCFRPTLSYAYVINGMLVILGTITMTHFSLVKLGSPFGLIANIALLWGKFAVGKAIFDLDFIKTDQDVQPKGRYFRYPNTGWWLVHLAGWTAVYALGNLLWK